MHYMNVTRINFNNSVINNYFLSFQELILQFKIPMGKRKDPFEIYRQIAAPPLKTSASTDRVYTLAISSVHRPFLFLV